MRSGRSPLTLAATAVLAGLALSACGGGGEERSAQGSPERSEQAAPSVPVPHEIETRPTPAASTAPPAPAGTPACKNPQLALAAAGGQGGAGTHIQRLEITNSGALCTLQGRPEVYPYDAEGARVKGFETASVPADFGTIGGKPGKVTLEKGGKAVLYVVINANDADGKSCPDAAGLAFQAPGDAGNAPVRLAKAWSPCPGPIQVSDIHPPTSVF
ncbi:DUF4232 domain-containing protein [Actinocorallia populi]|uniref:DUF4232 domain-containing protein n=1 Tax=Actinocorallia populi TaxID=2079200 RepID=UPI000D08942C|nr:DUF4232 domain-containing protein [Actinocorallia populi]